MSEQKVKIGWFGKHFGEEPPLVSSPAQGAGGIFFSGCNLHCLFCQNYQISHEGLGKYYSVRELASIMLDLQSHGAINIDLVTPTLWWQPLKEAIALARAEGLTVPIVWNSNGFESVDVLHEMAGFVDIYLPDFKYSDDLLAISYSRAPDYFNVARGAVREMLAQVGNLQIKENGLASRGVLVRHLVLPSQTENSYRVLETLARIDIGLNISLMNQYNPLNKKYAQAELSDFVRESDFHNVVDYARELGFQNIWIQEFGSSQVFLPDFTSDNPFVN